MATGETVVRGGHATDTVLRAPTRAPGPAQSPNLTRPTSSTASTRRSACHSRGCTGAGVRGRCAGERGQNASKDALWARRAAWHGHIDRNDIRDPTTARVVLTINTARAAAVTEGNDGLRVRRGLVRALQSQLHVLRHWSRDEQQVRVPRTCDESNAERFEVVEGIVERMDLKFATVAGTSIDMTDTERAAEH